MPTFTGEHEARVDQLTHWATEHHMHVTDDWKTQREWNAHVKADLKEIRTVMWKIGIACFVFAFLGGSFGSSTGAALMEFLKMVLLK